MLSAAAAEVKNRRYWLERKTLIPDSLLVADRACARRRFPETTRWDGTAVGMGGKMSPCDVGG